MVRMYLINFTLLIWLVMSSGILAGEDSNQASAVISDLTKATVKSGSNISHSSSISNWSNFPGKFLRIEMTRKSSDNQGSSNWFQVNTNVTPQPQWAKAESVELSIGLKRAAKCWLGVTLILDNGEEFLYAPIVPSEFTTEPIKRTIPLNKFKNKNGQALDIARVTGLSMGGRADTGVYYFSPVKLLLAQDKKEWLGVWGKGHNGGLVFEKGKAPELVFKITGDIPEDTKGFEYQITDFDGVIQAQGNINIEDGKAEYAIAPEIKAPGYYEVRAMRIGNNGKTDVNSCIRQQGSMSGSFATFAIMPQTIEQNKARMREYGEDGFFALHNPRVYIGLHELMGMPGALVYKQWKYIQPNKPQVPVEDLTDMINNRPFANPYPLPGYIFPHTSLASGMRRKSIPVWAKAEEKDAVPAYRNWQDFENYIRSYVRFHIKSTPHMTHRTYDALWEPENNTPKYWTGNHETKYTDVKQLVDLQERVAKVIREEDPSAVIIGPTSMWCYGLEWWEEFFKKGFFNSADGIASHFYCAAPPETNHIPRNLKTLRELIAKYTDKKVEIYNTETGFKSTVGLKHYIKEHAGWLSRYNLILLGEGVKKQYNFYVYDTPLREEWDTYGICFTRKTKENFTFNQTAADLLPKPAVPALAVISEQLTGAKPVRHLRDWGYDTWGYVYEKDNKPIVAIWNPFAEINLPVVAGNVSSVETVDLMGRHSTHTVTNGILTLKINQYPVFIHNLDPQIYLGNEAAKQDPVIHALPLIYPGQKKTIELEGISNITGITTWADLSAKVIDGSRIEVSTKSNMPAMAVPLIITATGADGMHKNVQWVCIGRGVQLESLSFATQSDEFGVKMIIANYTPDSINTTIDVDTDLSNEHHKTTTVLQPQKSTTVFIAVGKSTDIKESQREVCNLSVLIKPGEKPEIALDKKVYLLSAYPQCNNSTTNVFPDTIEAQSAGAAEKMKAKFKFAWDKDYLYINAELYDTAHHQTIADHVQLWKEDSLQIGFDTDPQSDYTYNPEAGIFNKIITELTIAKTESGVVVWRNRSNNTAGLPEDRVQADGMQIDINHNSNTNTTTYDCKLPWSVLGVTEASAGKTVGISMLVNDIDGKDDKRRMLPIFGGITPNKDYRKFGRVVLRDEK